MEYASSKQIINNQKVNINCIYIYLHISFIEKQLVPDRSAFTSIGLVSNKRTLDTGKIVN